MADAIADGVWIGGARGFAMQPVRRRNDGDGIVVTVDAVPLTVLDGRLMVLVGRRRAEPFLGREALVGAYVHPDEDADAEATVARTLAQKAGLTGIFLEQLRTFSGADRDPRGWSISVAYFALVPHERLAGVLGGELSLRPSDDPGPLAFDHNAIVAAALARVRGKGAYSTLPARLLPDEFTLTDLQQTYEVVTGERHNPSSFRRKIAELDIVEEIPGAMRREASRRPTQLFKLSPGNDVFERRI